MSIIYCEKHDMRYDSDYRDDCPRCENDCTSTHADSDGTGYCRGCGTTIGESHHVGCDVLEVLNNAAAKCAKPITG